MMLFICQSQLFLFGIISIYVPIYKLGGGHLNIKIMYSIYMISYMLYMFYFYKYMDYVLTNKIKLVKDHPIEKIF